ncbi:hypothetical protein C5E02_11815 [Rathayibacter rathayi]|uniref:Maltokinase N-terminal cap domain-containing protein n=2 Tax=Rathayibacter rathayi TaxID=33887 RepID=A0ABD6W523_RATRA|nr:hypothetical protein [Rathayibacter rathayi]AZZ49841.1 hypothetical protein C1O28_12135 [Rathayibacter rathayi]MWV75652.1 hypothetical protein [Rathayibacter rathayi NCPPB 2980 = VKM Ac-1601]PPF10016.1 hypothetical protein C5C04_13955 [Rathayibacter rathayi]PPF42581.1 hypothetical protein C5C08_14905 [Rathayibacter rathayi]PPG64630.1 hypothetical protein C5C16_14340 [Rathayibacter rathayi]
MALLHRATITPGKLEIVEAWAPTQPWCEVGGFSQLGAYRFDDPEGDVGVETLIVQAPGQPPLQVPLTYRGVPLPGGEEHLIATVEHTVLGRRWVYDGLGDPVAVAAFATAIRTGAREVEQYVEEDGHRIICPPTATVQGSGVGGGPVEPPASLRAQSDARTTTTSADGLTLVLARVLAPPFLEGERHLTGSWGNALPLPLATLA